MILNVNSILWYVNGERVVSNLPCVYCYIERNLPVNRFFISFLSSQFFDIEVSKKNC